MTEERKQHAPSYIRSERMSKTIEVKSDMVI